MQASPDLIWLTVRKNSCFLKKSRGVILTSEPGNLTAQNSFKFSGLANRETAAVDATKKGNVSKAVLKAKKASLAKQMSGVLDNVVYTSLTSYTCPRGF